VTNVVVVVAIVVDDIARIICPCQVVGRCLCQKQVDFDDSEGLVLHFQIEL